MQNIESMTASSLRDELKTQGLPSHGSRADLIARLSTKQKNTSPSPTEDIISFRGQNQPNPLIKGMYYKHQVVFDHIINLESRPFSADTDGEEGDLRREGSKLYMYREQDCEPGWYPLQFGRLRVI